MPCALLEKAFSTSHYQEAVYVILKCEFLNNMIAFGRVLRRNRTNKLYIDMYCIYRRYIIEMAYTVMDL